MDGIYYLSIFIYSSLNLVWQVLTSFFFFVWRMTLHERWYELGTSYELKHTAHETRNTATCNLSSSLLLLLACFCGCSIFDVRKMRRSVIGDRWWMMNDEPKEPYYSSLISFLHLIPFCTPKSIELSNESIFNGSDYLSDDVVLFIGCCFRFLTQTYRHEEAHHKRSNNDAGTTFICSWTCENTQVNHTITFTISPFDGKWLWSAWSEKFIYHCIFLVWCLLVLIDKNRDQQTEVSQFTWYTQHIKSGIQRAYGTT